MDSLFRVLILPVLSFLLIVFLGTYGYMALNHISFIDALQLVIVTIATCGLREPANTTFWGKIFDIGFIIVSFTVIIAVLSKTFSLVVEGQIKGIQVRDRMRKTLKKIKDHYLICGFGRVGSQVASQLRQSKIPFVAIDSNPLTEEKLQALNIPYVIGNISSDDVLKKANLEQAKGLVACADSDMENVFVTLSARNMKPELVIIARASDPANEEKLRRAGANHVISPYLTTGQRMSGIILNPSVADFVDRVLHDQSLEIWFQEIKIPKNSRLVGRTIKEADLRKKSGVIIIAIKRRDNSFRISPDADTKIDPEDTFICIGSINQIKELKGLC
jgi:voltage-gated potassium channel